MTTADEKKHCGHECVCYEHIDNLAFLKKRMGEIVCNGIISDGTSDGCKCKNDTRYQCGDGCHGECSGEVNGVPHCPHEEKMYLISESELDDAEAFGLTPDSPMVKGIRARGPVEQASSERYTGSCIFQDECTDYSDFLESIEDEPDPDGEDPVCPIKCDSRKSPSAAHDAEVAARITAQLTAQHEQELRDAVEGARLKVLEGGGKP